MIEAMVAPRLPDEDYLKMRLDEPRPEQAWQYVLGWLPLGWCMAPPRFEPQQRRYVVVAYNVSGCLEAPSYVGGVAETITGALLNVGWNLEPCGDEECTRDKYRRRN